MSLLSPPERDKFKMLYPILLNQSLTEIFHKSKDDIQYIAKKYNLKKDVKKYAPYEINYIKRNIDSDAKDIAMYLNAPIPSVRNLIMLIKSNYL